MNFRAQRTGIDSHRGVEAASGVCAPKPTPSPLAAHSYPLAGETNPSSPSQHLFITAIQHNGTISITIIVRAASLPPMHNQQPGEMS